MITNYNIFLKIRDYINNFNSRFSTILTRTISNFLLFSPGKPLISHQPQDPEPHHDQTVRPAEASLLREHFVRPPWLLQEDQHPALSLHDIPGNFHSHVHPLHVVLEDQTG